MDSSGGQQHGQLRAVVLAAGGSTRMGRCKALLDWGGQPLVVQHVRGFQRLTDDVKVVVGAHAAAIAAVVSPELLVFNDRWSSTEMIDSLRLAVGAWTGAVIVTPVDTPPASPALLRALASSGRTAVCVAPDGRRGHPLLLAANAVARLDAVQSLREMLLTAVEVFGPSECAEDFDDPAALRRVRDGGG